MANEFQQVSRQRSRIEPPRTSTFAVLMCYLACVAGVPLPLASSARAQAVPSSDLAHSYKGLVAGKSTRADVIAKLGPAPIQTEREDDMRYPVAGRPGQSDRLFFRRGKLALITAASPDSRYATRREIVDRFGEPESHIEFQTQEYLDYTERGLRFICDRAGGTVGIVYFAPSRRRVPAGYPQARLRLRPAPATHVRVKAPRDFRVGTAQRSIAPQRYDNLTADGKQNPAHLAEDLLARVAIFQRGPATVVLVGLDVFGMGAWDLDALRESLAEKGFANVVIAMSHTHANVDTIGFYGYYPREYAKHIIQQTEAAVLAAAQTMVEVQRLKLGAVEMPLAGGRVVDLIRNGRDAGLVDPTVSIIQAIGKDGRPIANVVHMACHPEVIRLEQTRGLSPDFVGTLCTQVTRELGGQTVFLNGALGGMLTPDTRFRTQEAAEEMGARLADYVIQAAKNAQESGSYGVWMVRRPVQYPITGESVVQFLQNPPGPIDFHQGRIRTEMNLIWIGDAQLITVPGELLPDIGLEIMSKMRGRLRLVVGLANAELGYLVPSFDFRAGHYEERTGPGAAGGAITRSVGLELAPRMPPDS